MDMNTCMKRSQEVLYRNVSIVRFFTKYSILHNDNKYSILNKPCSIEVRLKMISTYFQFANHRVSSSVPDKRRDSELNEKPEKDSTFKLETITLISQRLQNTLRG